MASGFVIRKNQYYDSIFLMGINKRLSEIEGVQQTAALMGSDKNKQLLTDIGIHGAAIENAQPNDLIVALIAEKSTIVESVLGRLDDWLQASMESAPASDLHTLEEGLARRPDANLAVISVPGEYAGRETRKALEAGLNVFLFSSNVPVEEELELKQFAAHRGLLVMGPDCGTSLIGGKGIGFANAVRIGPIGAIGAAGTGLQEFTSQVHNAGWGISHAIGTGSHDLSDSIGGLTTLTALDALEADPMTKVIAIISKPPGARTLEKLMTRMEACSKPVIGCFLGLPMNVLGPSGQFKPARIIDEAVQLSLADVEEQPSRQSDRFSPPDQERLTLEKAAWSSEQKYLRGLFAGGTFCYQSQQIFRDAGISMNSNAPLDPERKLADPDCSLEHTLVDMGDDYYTLGKPHPMIDGTLRKQRIQAEGRDPKVSILLLDFILGYNASMDPVGELLDAILDARQAANRRGGHLTVVASICGTGGDTQGLDLQVKMLEEAGVIVFFSNAKAASFCCELLK